MTQQELIFYEVASMWCDWLLPTEWAARYIAWKVDRKVKQYERWKQIRVILDGSGSDDEKFVKIWELDHQ